jgi:hypothetical protein
VTAAFVFVERLPLLGSNQEPSDPESIPQAAAKTIFAIIAKRIGGYAKLKSNRRETRATLCLQVLIRCHGLRVGPLGRQFGFR